MTAAEFLERLEGVQKDGAGWKALCPGHADKRPSLGVLEGTDGQIVLRCRAGCETGAVLAELGLEMRDLFPRKINGKGTGEVRYRYTDADGNHLFDVVRRPGKRFHQEPASGKRGTGAMDGVERVPYGLPEVLAAVRLGEAVWIAEGEKDADALRQAGVTARCNPGGAGTWKRTYTDVLRDARSVVIVADRDDAGRQHARTVGEQLAAAGVSSVIVVEPAEGKDAADHLDAGRGLGEFQQTTVFVSSPKGSTREETKIEGAHVLPFAPIMRSLRDAPPEPEWLWRGFVAAGVVTLLAGKPKVGKSTMMFGLFRALEDGSAFIGEKARPTGVLLLSEERPDSLAEKARDWSLGDGIHLLMRHEMGEMTWPEVIAHAVAYMREHSLRLLVIDTLDKWAPMPRDAENSSGAVLEALRPLMQAAGSGVSVLVSTHQRKSGGSDGEAVRGSNAIAGAVDIILELERARGVDAPHMRVLRAASRFRATPEEVALTLEGTRYDIVVGGVGAMRAGEEQERCLAVLTTTPKDIKVIAEAAEVTQRAARDHLRDLTEQGRAVRSGEGKKGDPHLWALPDIRFVPNDLLGDESNPRADR